MLQKKHKHIQRQKAKRQKGKYKQIGLFFIVFGLLLVLCTLVLYPLYYFGILFQNDLYIAPIPVSSTAIAKSQNSGDQINELKTDLTKADLPYSDVQQVDNGYDVTLTSEGEVIFANNKDLDSQIASLQHIITRLTIDGKRFTRLDFRFEKPIIVIKNK